MQDAQIPEFNPYILEYMKKDPQVLETKGKIPQYVTQSEKRVWLNKLDECRTLLEDDIKPYIYPDGPVIGYAWDSNGYFEVILYEGMNVTDSQINEIYDLISKKADKASVQEIPVVFFMDDFFQNEVSGYTDRYRPVIGAIQVTGETGARGTIGFAAKKSDGTKGYVTVQHLGTYVGYKMYQPTNSTSNAIGSVSIISGNNADACFVPYINVAAKIHIGDGTTVDVSSYIGTAPTDAWTGLEIYMSGKNSGVQQGHIKGRGNLYDNGITYNNMVKADYTSVSGDSGAPIYRKISSSDYRLLGIHKGTFYGYKWFSPISGIKSDLGVTPITA